MCGIAGYWGDLPSAVPPTAFLKRMNDAQAHRGPDGEGIWVGERIGLGHRRLAIIDLDLGAQPMASVDERYQIVFNGEIYNYRALRQELEQAGYNFKTHCDTEVIPATIDRWGVTDGIKHLRGMFAFALFDARDQTLLLARDPFGIKPLYIGYADQLILFASEPKALLATNLLSNQADPVALLDYFTLSAPLSPRTAWRAIRELEPGTWVRFGRTDKQTGRFWFSIKEPIEWRGTSQAVTHLETVLTDSLRAHLESDVPIAAFLSGGIDSSTLVALLRKHLVADLKTFNVAFAEEQFDESYFARLVAEHCHTDHHEIRLAFDQNSPELFCQILGQYDQPFGDSSCIPTWFVCQEMAKYSKVVISGDGGDEMFWGYGRLSTARRLARLGWFAPVLAFAAQIGRRIPRRSDLARQLNKAAEYARMPRAEMLCALDTYFTGQDLRALFQPDFLSAAMRDGPTSQRFVRLIPELTDPAEQLLKAERTTLLHADYLRKVDVASMAHGLEVRTPFLDTQVLSFARRLAPSLKLHHGTRKYIMRRLANELLPPVIAQHPKAGFGIPFDTWMDKPMHEWARDFLLGSGSQCRDWLNIESVRGLIDMFDGAVQPLVVSRYQVYERVFMLLSFELWLRKWKPARQ